MINIETERLILRVCDMFSRTGEGERGALFEGE